MEKKVKQWILYAYFFCMLIIYPLIMHDKYFDLTDTKLMTYYMITALLVIATFVYIFLFEIKDCGAKKEFVLLGIVALDIILSYIINGHTHEMLTGLVEYGTGIIFLLSLVIACAAVIFLSNADTRLVFSYLVASSAILVGGFTLIQFCGIDIFYLIAPILEEERFLFLGPLGNVANLGCYAVIVLPICAYSLSEKEHKALQILGAVGIFLATVTCIVSNTDGSILALVVVLLLLGYLMRETTSLTILIVALALFTTGIISRFDSASRMLDVHQQMLVDSKVSLPLLCLAAALLIVQHVAPNTITAKLSMTIHFLCLLGLVGICLLPFVVIVYTNSHDYASNSLFGGILYFDNHWGTDRGFIWMSAVKIFTSGSPLQILFGRGAGGFYQAYMESYYDLSLELGLFSNFDAHNMFLQFLCEYGIVGLGSVLAFLILRIKKGLASPDFFYQAKATALIGAMVASFFIVFQHVTLGLLGVLL